MCANYRPSAREELMALPLPPPDFDYGEAYPGSIVPIVTNFAPRMWVPVSFGLIPSWAKDAKITRPERDQTSVVGGRQSWRWLKALSHI